MQGCGNHGDVLATENSPKILFNFDLRFSSFLPTFPHAFPRMRPSFPWPRSHPGNKVASNARLSIKCLTTFKFIFCLNILRLLLLNIHRSYQELFNFDNKKGCSN